MKDIYIIGSMNMDLACYAPRFPKVGETIEGHGFREGAGGKGLNQAIASARLGGKVHFLGAIGEDSFGNSMKKILADEGIDTSFIKTIKGVSSGVALIEVAEGTNRIMLDLGANLQIEEADITEFLKDSKEGDIFLCQGENGLETIKDGLSIAKRKGLYTILNPAPAKIEMKECFSNVDLLLPNETEAAILHGKDFEFDHNPFSVPNIAITLGKDGYAYFGEETEKKEPAPQVKAIDSTGAGDAFVGSLAFFLSKGVSLMGSLHYAMVYASLKTTRKGTSIAMPTYKEFESYMVS